MRGIRSFVIVTLGLVALALSNHKGQLLKSEQAALPAGSLRCQEVAKIARWGLSHHGGNLPKKLQDPKTTEKALAIFADKLDPYKVLFTASEVEDFKQGAQKEWRSLIEGRSCGFFEAWLNQSLPQAQRRLEASLRSLSLKASDKPGKVTPINKQKVWAPNELGLHQRVAVLADQIVRGTPQPVIKAFRSDLHALVKNSFEENLLASGLSSSSLLAKSILGTFDPYSTYLSSAEFEDFYSDLSGGASGIGIRVRKVPTGVFIEEVLQDSAASQSGKIKKNDIIVKVDGKETQDLSMNEIKDLLKGPENSKVRLDIQPEEGQKQALEITRKRFDYEESKITLKEKDSIAVVSIPNFYGNVGFDSNGVRNNGAAEDLRKVLEDLNGKAKKPEAMVLDLRGNPGGFLEEAVSMASFFVGSQPVVGVVEKDATRVLKEEFQEPLYNGKLVVLVDNGTASAAEVLAGALSDLQRAIVAGTGRTYGKGTVQKLFSLDEELLEIGLSQKKGNGVLKLTTSIFYSPMGHSPANGGVKSDIVLPATLMASKEDYGTAPPMEVKEEKPFLDDATVTELQIKKAMQEGLIKSLSELSAMRLSSPPSSSNEDAALAEASQIASDLAKKSSPAL